MKLSDEQLDLFRQAALAIAGRADVHSAVEAVYASLGDAIDLRKPVCDSSGRCCRFEEFCHSLFVTTAEMGSFLNNLNQSPDPTWDGRGCPFQLQKLCGVHTIRPLGCRVFYCDPTASIWQQEQYERHHTALKRLHERLEVPYFFVEWRQALAAVGITAGRVSGMGV